MARSTHRRLQGLATCAVTLATLAAPAGAQAQSACPGAAPACLYTSSSQIGQRGGGVLRFPQTVAIGPDGLVYVGDQSSSVVQVFSPDGTFRREVGAAGTRPGEMTSVGAIAVTPDNTLLVAVGTNRVDRFNADGTLVGSFGSSGTGVGQFHFGAGGGNDAPAGGGLTVGGGYIFVSDSQNDRLQRFGLDGSGATEIVPPGLLANPRGLATRGQRLIVADDHHHRLVVMDFGGRVIRTVGSGQGSGRNQFSFPFGVAVDPQGRVFVADDINQRVLRFGPQPDYKYKARWGSYGTGPGQLAYPRAIASDSSGALYVTNTGNDRIDVFDRGGRLLRSFGTSGRGPGQFNAPLGVAADANGLRAVADSVNGRIELLNPDGSIASIWGSPSPGPTILRQPVAVAFDAAGDAYVLDRRRGRIFVFARASGLPARTIATQGSGPGQLLDPAAIAIDSRGTISVADSGNKRVARFSTARRLPRLMDEPGHRARRRRHPGRLAHIRQRDDQPDHGLRLAGRRAQAASAARDARSASSPRPRRSRSTPAASCGSPTAATAASSASGPTASRSACSASAASGRASSSTRAGSSSTAWGR